MRVKTIQELDRVGSFEAAGKELRLQNPYDIKSDLLLARMMAGVNEVTKHATVVLRRDPKFEVRGSKFRKPRTSDLEPLPVLLVPPVSRGCSAEMIFF